MNYRFHSSIYAGAVILAVVVAPIVYFIVELAVMALRGTPIGTSLAVLAPVFSVVLFLFTHVLKPIYRQSYRTHGLSLLAR